MCSKGQALLLKGNEITYDGLAMIDDAQEELSKLCPDKSLKSHPKVQPSEQNMSSILKMINFKDLMQGRLRKIHLKIQKPQSREGFYN